MYYSQRHSTQLYTLWSSAGVIIMGLCQWVARAVWKACLLMVPSTSTSTKLTLSYTSVRCVAIFTVCNFISFCHKNIHKPHTHTHTHTHTGGAPTNTNISQITRGAFSTGFSGCISQIASGPISHVSDLPISSATSGHAITHCS